MGKFRKLFCHRRSIIPYYFGFFRYNYRFWIFLVENFAFFGWIFFLVGNFDEKLNKFWLHKAIPALATIVFIQNIIIIYNTLNWVSPTSHRYLSIVSISHRMQHSLYCCLISMKANALCRICRLRWVALSWFGLVLVLVYSSDDNILSFPIGELQFQFEYVYVVKCQIVVCWPLPMLF